MFTPERGRGGQNGFAGRFCAWEEPSRDVGAGLAFTLGHSRGQAGAAG